MVTTLLTNVGDGNGTAVPPVPVPPLSAEVFFEPKEAKRLASTSTVVTTIAVVDGDDVVDNPTMFTEVPLPGKTTEYVVVVFPAPPLALTAGFTTDMVTVDGPST
jgi:hypothetical protein